MELRPITTLSDDGHAIHPRATAVRLNGYNPPAMDGCGILVFTAVALEAKGVARALEMRAPQPGRPTETHVLDRPVSLHLVGIAARGLPQLRAAENCRWVIMAGLAGALDPALDTGQIVIDGCPEPLCQRLGHRHGPIHTADRIIEEPAQKSALFRSTAALAVDMESAAVRSWAADAGLTFIGIRAICDRADKTLDATVLRLVDEWGRPRPGAVAAALGHRPARLGALLRLRADSNRAAGKLGPAVRELIQRLTELP